MPSHSTTKKLFSVSGNRCAFPGCGCVLFDPDSGTLNAEVAHIKGKRRGSARYDLAQSAADRDGFDNLMLLCPTHHSEIDSLPVSRYTVEWLQEIKRQHESTSHSLVLEAEDERSAVELAHQQSVVNHGASFIERFLIATWQLLIQPMKSLAIDKDGRVTSYGVSGPAFWLAATFFALSISLLASSFGPHYSPWFFLIQMTYSAVRMAICIPIWIVVGFILGLRNQTRTLIDICLFSVGLVSLCLTPAAAVWAAKHGFREVIRASVENPAVISAHFTPSSAEFILAIAASMSLIYPVTFATRALSISIPRATSLVLLQGLLYGLVRPIAVEPLYKIVAERLINPPW